MNRVKQRGGTFLGLILGMMIGIAVCLAVAIWVAKVPVPFVNKNAVRSGGQEAAEAEKNRDWDPNASLRGRGGSGGGVQPAVVPAPDPAPIAAPTEPTPPATAARPSTPSGDPLGDFAAARTGGVGQAQQVPATSDPLLTYFVQAGAFRTPQDAEAQRARLSLMDVEARVSEGEQAGRPVYRVRVGPLQNGDAANRVKERLAANGFDAALVRVPR
jgi:cell division protein FtsN